MAGSIDPRCETIRGTHWPNTGRVVVWSSRRGNNLGQRSKSTASTGRTYECNRSDQTVKKLLWHGGRPHMGPCFRRDDKGARRRPSLAAVDLTAHHRDGALIDLRGIPGLDGREVGLSRLVAPPGPPAVRP